VEPKRIGQTEGPLKRLPARDAGIVERGGHLFDQMRSARHARRRIDAAAREFACLVVLEFGKEGGRP
jgi:hypothetical protein